MSVVEQALVREMATWEQAGLRRRMGGEADEGLVDFTSNDYLSLSGAPAVVEAAREALAQHGAGGRASRLLGGGSPLHAEAERAAAAWLEAEAALLFPSGYQASLGLVPSLVGRGDALFSDRLNHASLIDAARLSRAQVFVHGHGDLDELARRLRVAASARRRLVVTEGVFSMDGDHAPLADLHALCIEHDAWLLVDEAHAAGVAGPEGAGAWAAFGGDDDARLAARVVTGGKALGVAGAFVVGSAALREHLLNRARTFVYTTAPSPAVAGALVAAIDLCRRADDERARCTAAARTLADRLGLERPSAGIVPVVVGPSEAALAAAERAREAGYDVRAVRPPTVPEGTSRLRVACHAHNTPEQVEDLARHLAATPRPTGTPVTGRTRRPLFVVGTDTGVGKTVVSALLLRAASRLGDAVYWKPVQTGADHDVPTVARLAASGTTLPPAFTFARPASPHEAAEAEGASVDPRRLADELRRHRSEHAEARLLVELAGGLLVPYDAGDAPYTQADWLAREGADVVVVARSGLGTLNHTLLTLEALRSRHLEPRALFLVGERHDANRRTLGRLSGVDPVYEVPVFDSLDATAFDAWIDGEDLTPVLEA